MREIIIGVLVSIVVLVGAFLLFTYNRDGAINECNGEQIGKESSGQMRMIYKCSDGSMLII